MFPGSVNKEGFWRDILAGKDLLTDVPATHWLIDDYYDADPKARDKTYARRGAFLPEVDFDPVAWGLPPTLLPNTDTTQLLALIVAQQVLEDACGTQFKTVNRERISVILGVTSAQELLGNMVSRLQKPVWVKALREMGLPESKVQDACDRIASHYVEWKESTFPGVLGNVVAGRIANRLNLGGTNCVTDAACASSLSALSMAVSELRLGQSDMVITGGADTMNDIFMYICFSKTPALSPTGDCRPFSDQADGTMLGEGLGMLALKRLADAERDGDRIYALIKGIGTSSDGRSKSVYAPVAAGQAVALRRAYEEAGYSPSTVQLVEAHGTGTRAGDAAEFEGLRTVFDEAGRGDKAWCALGSVKSQVGHTKAAAGAAGLFKAVMALHHKVLPPTIKVQRPDPKLNIEQSPFYLNTVPRPWVRSTEHPRRASVSSFGFGGSNFHVALEEYTGPATAARLLPDVGHVVLLSGTQAELAARCAALAAQFDEAPAGVLAFVAWDSQRTFEPKATARLSVFAASEADAAAKFKQAEAIVKTGHDLVSPAGIEFCATPASGSLAFLFPGQGSQYLGMAADTVMGVPSAMQAWEQACGDAGSWGAALAEVTYPQPVFDDEQRQAQALRLTATEWAQPAIGATSLALLKILRALQVEPAYVAGHSFGEVTALHAAGVFGAADVMHIARKRGELMAAASATPGAMLGVATALVDVQQHLRDAGHVGPDARVVVANHNTPKQVVLSGHTADIEAMEARLKTAGVNVTRLNVSTAFHSPLVAGAAVPLQAFLQDVHIGPPVMPVFANTTAGHYPTDENAIRELLANQVANPVRFVEQIEAMYAAGVRTFVEVGPGHVLTALVGHILKDRPHRAVALDRKGRNGLSTLLQGLGALALAGNAIDFSAWWQPFAQPTDPRLQTKPALTLKVGGASFGKPYPPAGGAAALPKPNEESPVSQPLTPAAAPAPVAPAPAAMPVMDASVQYAWVMAITESQRQTAEAHAAFARAMAETHAAFLRSAEASLMGLNAALGGNAVAPSFAPPAPVFAAPPAPVFAAPPAPVFAAPPAPVFAAPPAPVVAAPPAPAPMFTAPPTPSVVPAPPTPAPSQSTPAGLSLESLQALMLQVVASRTGYPEEMLGLGMDLEADLGVDSIKRVEILSAVMERAPGLPEVNTAKMASMRTLAEIVAYLAKEGGLGANGTSEHHKANGKPNGKASESNGAVEGVPRPLVESPGVTTLGRQALRAVVSPALGLATAGVLDGRVIITDDGQGVAFALAERLRNRGAQVQVCLATAVPSDANVLIALDGLRGFSSPAGADAINRESFIAARSVAAAFEKNGGTFITVQDTGGDFGLSGSHRAWVAGISALARTAAIEWPQATVRALDVERDERTAEQIADAIANELMAGGPELEIGLRADGTRVRLALEASALTLGANTKVDRAQTSFVVATGGARGVTAACLRALAEAAPGRFLLLGRTALQPEPAACAGAQSDAELKRALLMEARAQGATLTPAALGRQTSAVLANREVNATLAALNAAGSEAAYEAVDVTDAAAVAATIDRYRARWGAVSGVVHGAGVLADKLIAQKTDEQYTLVTRTKVQGLRALLQATAQDALRFLCLFSSVAARSGNLGQCDYAMANEILNKVAHEEQRRRGPSCVVRSLGWGPWDGGMVDDGLRARFAAMGVSLIPVPAGAQAMLNELAFGPQAATEVVLGATNEDDGASHSLAGPDAGHELECEVHVNHESHAYLDGHRIKGVPVVPVALVIDWFARAAHALRPDLVLSAIRNVKVLRGVRLFGFDQGATERVVIKARQLSNGGQATLSLELRSTEGAKLYTATGEMRTHASIATRPAPVLEALQSSPRVVYGQAPLFHGPTFQMIDALTGIAPGGLAATINGVLALSWHEAGAHRPWRTDPAAVDAALQLALLWTHHKVGGVSLPTGLEALLIHKTGPWIGRVHATLQTRHPQGEHKDRCVVDVVFVNDLGDVLGEALGIETHVIASGEPVPAAVVV